MPRDVIHYYEEFDVINTEDGVVRWSAKRMIVCKSMGGLASNLISEVTCPACLEAAS